MLSAEEKFFLSVLADHLNGRPTALVPGLDWKILYNVAEQHQFSALFYAQCGAFIPPEAELLFLRDYGAAVAGYAARQKIAAEIDRAFTHHKIPYVPLKGLVVAESYPQPELRTMGDIDILVRMEDKERAHSVLLETGGQGAYQGDHEWFYRKDSWKIELHHRLLYDDPFNAPADVAFCKKIWEYVSPVPDSSRCELDPDFHFLFLLLHLKKHIIYSGAGFRQFMDLAVTAQRWPINWSQTEKWLAETGLLSFAGRGMALCRKWFQLTLPLAESAPDPAFELHITQQTFRNGLFGYDNADNADNWQIAEMEAGGGDSFPRRLQMCIKTLIQCPAGKSFRAVWFPEYETLRKLQNYSFVDQRPWLVPFVWFYRFGHCIWFKIFRSCKIMMIDRRKIRERRQMLKKLGL